MFSESQHKLEVKLGHSFEKKPQFDQNSSKDRNVVHFSNFFSAKLVDSDVFMGKRSTFHITNGVKTAPISQVFGGSVSLS